MNMGGKWVHRLTSKDLAAETAVCANCGPVTIGWKYFGGARHPRCSVAVAQGRNSPNRGSRWRNHKKAHGLTWTEAREMTAGQTCAICGTAENLCVDHCHASNEVRGVLCRNCNTGLGMFQESPSLLAAAIAYLNDVAERTA